MSAQAPQSTDLSTRSGEEGRFREAVNRQVPRPGPGMLHTTVPGGTVLTPLRSRGRSSALNNFHVTVFTVDGQKKIRVANGQLGGITPTLNGGATLDTVPAPSCDITGIGAEYVYAKLVVTHTDTLGFVHISVIDTVDIKPYSSLQVNVLTGTYYKLIATLNDGVVVRPQPVLTSLNVSFLDDGSYSGKAVASYPRA